MSQDAPDEIRYVRYDGARENEYVAGMRQLIAKDLSEPYSIYVYRYFLYQWGDLCFLAMDEKDEMIGVVISKLEAHRGGPLRGYIAMLAVNKEFRGRGIATKLVRMAIDAMIERDADEVYSFLISHPEIFLLLMSILDCPRNRDHQYRRDETLRAPWLPPQQATPPILFKWQLGLPSCSLPERRHWLYSDGC